MLLSGDQTLCSTWTVFVGSRSPDLLRPPFPPILQRQRISLGDFDRPSALAESHLVDGKTEAEVMAYNHHQDENHSLVSFLEQI